MKVGCVFISCLHNYSHAFFFFKLHEDAITSECKLSQKRKEEHCGKSKFDLKLSFKR